MPRGHFPKLRRADDPSSRRPGTQAASNRTDPTLEQFLKGRTDKPALEYTAEYQQAQTLHFKTGEGFRLFGHVAGFL